MIQKILKNEDTSSIKTLVGENKKKTTKMLPLSVSKARLNVGPFQIIRVRHEDSYMRWPEYQ